MKLQINTRSKKRYFYQKCFSLTIPGFPVQKLVFPTEQEWPSLLILELNTKKAAIMNRLCKS